MDPARISANNRLKFPLWMYENTSQVKKNENENPIPETGDQVLISHDSGETAESDSSSYKGMGARISVQPEESFLNEPVAPPRAKWTILAYQAGDNDLEKYIVQDVVDMEKSGTTSAVNLVVQLDRGENPSAISEGWKGARRIEIREDEDSSRINSPVIEDMGQVNMSSPRTLYDFVTWGMKKYPAEHYMLLISDHGKGWVGAVEDVSHNENPSAQMMTIPRMRRALEMAQRKTGEKIDVLGFDACLMAQSEVAYELKDVADYMVASQAPELANGWPYENILSRDILKNIHSAMLMKVNFDPRSFAMFMVKSASAVPEDLPTLSAVDMKKMDNVAKASREMAMAVMKTDTPKDVLNAVARKTQRMEGFKDQYDFCRRIVTSDMITDGDLKESARKVMDAIYSAVLLEEHSQEYPDAHGLTFNLPSYKLTGALAEQYRETRFNKDTGWGSALEFLGRMG